MHKNKLILPKYNILNSLIAFQYFLYKLVENYFFSFFHKFIKLTKTISSMAFKAAKPYIFRICFLHDSKK